MTLPLVDKTGDKLNTSKYFEKHKKITKVKLRVEGNPASTKSFLQLSCVCVF